jgi:hypothetical protein
MTPLIVVALLALSTPARALPPCPSTWDFGFSTPRERWPDVDRATDPGLLHGMARALYEDCPRREANDALLNSAAEKYLRVSERDPDQGYPRQEARFWLADVYALSAEDFDRQNVRAHAALSHLIALDDPDLRARASAHARALRLRGARQAAYVAYYTQLNARNMGKPGWRGSSQRIRCFLNTYPDTSGDPEIQPRLLRLLAQSRGFIAEHAADPRYDLAGMRALSAALASALEAPPTAVERWPIESDIDPASAEDPENCYRRPSPIPGPEHFDFDFPSPLTKARERAEAVLGSVLP